MREHPASFFMSGPKQAELKASQSAGQRRKNKGEANPYPFRFQDQDCERSDRADQKKEPIATAVLGVFFVLFHVQYQF